MQNQLLAGAPVGAGRRVASASQPTRRTAIMLPGAPRLLLMPLGTVATIRIRNRTYTDVTEAALIGPTSQAVLLHYAGALPTEHALGAGAWPRIAGTPASAAADRVIAAPALNLDADGLLLAAGRPASGSAQQFDALADRLDRLVAVGGIDDVAGLVDALGTTPSALRRLSLRYFGLPPKVLLMRRRFLGALAAVTRNEMDMQAALDFGYFDTSHFLRDAKRFLGMTPRGYQRALAMQD